VSDRNTFVEPTHGRTRGVRGCDSFSCFGSGLWRTVAWHGSFVVSLSTSPEALPNPPATTPKTYELTWDAPPECGSADSIARRVAALLSVPLDGNGTMLVRGVIQYEGDGYALSLGTVFEGRAQERTFESADCASLAETTAVVIALALEPMLGSSLDEGPRAVGAEATVPAPSTMPNPPERREATRPPLSSQPLSSPPPLDADGNLVSASAATGTGGSVTHVGTTFEPSLRLQAGVEYGALDAFTAVLGVGFGLGWPHVALVVDARYWIPRATVEDGVGGLYQMAAAAVSLCGRFEVRAFEVPVCGGIEAGVVVGRSRGVSPSRTIAGPWFGPMVGVGVLRRYGRVAWSIAVDVTGRAYGTRFSIGESRVLTPFPVSIRVLVGLDVRLGSRRKIVRSPEKNRGQVDTAGR